MSILRVKGLTAKYGRRLAIDKLDLDIDSGEVVGFLGPNGAGKTTTLKSIMGLLPSKFVEIKIDEFLLKTQFEQAMKNIVFMSDNNIFYSYLTGFQNINFYAKFYGRTKSDVLEAIEQVGLKSRMHDKVKTYSLGMKQRLALARCICINPKIIIMDEPFNGVDLSGVRFIKDLVIKLSQNNNTAFLISSHNLHELQNICTRFVIIKDGIVLDNIQKTDTLDLESKYLQLMGH
jgi:ABC-2 type transport system ATP-binding protein